MSQGKPTDKEIDVYSTAIVLDGMTQSDAWRKAYPKSKARNNIIHNKASFMHNLEQVQVRIREKRLEQIKKDQEIFDSGLNKKVMTKIELVEILSTQRRINMSDVADFKNIQVGEKDSEPVYQTVWCIKNSEDMNPEIAMMIKSVTITKTGPKIELHDATAAGKQLSELMGWNAPKELDVKVKDAYENMTDAEIEALLLKQGIKIDK